MLKYRLYKSEALKMYSFLERNQFMDADCLYEQSIRNRDKLVKFAFDNISYYQKKYTACGFEIGDQACENYFEKLPILTKTELRNSFDEIVNENLREFAGTSTTGGSTGVPTKVRYDRRIALEPYRWRMQSWWGIGPGDHGAYVWRMRRTDGLKNFINEALWWPTRKLCLDASLMDAAKITGFVRKFNAVRPSLLQGYVGAVYELALHIRAHSLKIHSPKAIWVTSSPVSNVQRSAMESVFGAPVYDQYGCCESAHIAAECSAHSGLHLNCELNMLEFTDEHNRAVADGEWGNVLITKLQDYVFPLIRYEVGDVGRFLGSPCPCGVKLPLIDNVKGRVTDIIRLPSGRIISGDHMTTIFDGSPDVVDAFQVIQHKDYAITVRCVPACVTSANLDKIRTVVSEFEKKIGSEVKVSLETVGSIAHDRGKVRFVINELE